MARYYQTSNPVYGDLGIFQPNWELAQKSVSKKDAEVGNIFDTLDLLGQLNIDHWREADQKNVENIKKKYEEEVDKLTKSLMSSDLLNTRQSMAGIRKLQNVIKDDFNSGEIARIQATASAKRQLDKDYEEMYKEDPTVANQYYSMIENYLNTVKEQGSLQSVFNYEKLMKTRKLWDEYLNSETFKSFGKDSKVKNAISKRGDFASYLTSKTVTQADKDLLLANFQQFLNDEESGLISYGENREKYHKEGGWFNPDGSLNTNLALVSDGKGDWKLNVDEDNNPLYGRIGYDTSQGLISLTNIEEKYNNQKLVQENANFNFWKYNNDLELKNIEEGAYDTRSNTQFQEGAKEIDAFREFDSAMENSILESLVTSEELKEAKDNMQVAIANKKLKLKSLGVESIQDMLQSGIDYATKTENSELLSVIEAQQEAYNEAYYASFGKFIKGKSPAEARAIIKTFTKNLSNMIDNADIIVDPNSFVFKDGNLNTRKKRDLPPSLGLGDDVLSMPTVVEGKKTSINELRGREITLNNGEEVVVVSAVSNDGSARPFQMYDKIEDNGASVLISLEILPKKYLDEYEEAKKEANKTSSSESVRKSRNDKLKEATKALKNTRKLNDIPTVLDTEKSVGIYRKK